MARMRTADIDGVPFPKFIIKETYDNLRDFRPRHDDLFIATYPKSGITWTQQIVKLIRLNGEDDHRMIDDVIPWIETRNGQRKIETITPPRAFRSHCSYQMMPGGLPEKSPAKYIYIARNPKDVAVSAYHHYKASKSIKLTGDWNSYFELFISGQSLYGSWFDHVLGWWEHKDAPNILFLKYEDMKEDHRGAIKAIARFLDYTLTPEVIDLTCERSSFNSMKENPATNYSWAPTTGPQPFNLMRKGIVGDWKNHFSEEQSLRLDKEYSKRITGTGLDFRF